MSLDDTNLEWLRLSSPLTVQLNQLAWWMIEWAQVVCVCVFVCLALISRLSIQRIRIRIHLSANAVQVSSCILAEALPGAKFAPPNAGSHGLHLHALKRSILIILNHSLIQTLQRCCPITATSTVINREERRHWDLCSLSLSLTSSRNVQRSLFVYSEAANEVA